ncbi:MAG: hypothetical protein LC775_01725, partial [Acidobacteria bacterium]|nr:hypothetical protein [Acidobacteriota bacterium]
ATLLDMPDRPPAGHAELAARINEAFVHSQTERWSRLGPLLPDLIVDAWHASCTSTGAAQRRAFGQLALVWRVTSGMLDRIGEKDLPWIAAERDLAAADRSEDELLIAGAAWRLAVVLRHSGRLPESIEVPLATADALRPHLAQSPRQASLYGALMLRGAVGSATLGDHVAVRDYLGECDRAAERTGDRNDFWLAFGPPNVAIHRVWLAVELGDPTDALRQAAHVDDTILPPALAERRTSHLITVAWSHYLHRHEDDALAALTAARSAAPEQLMCTTESTTCSARCCAATGATAASCASWPSSSACSSHPDAVRARGAGPGCWSRLSRPGCASYCARPGCCASMSLPAALRSLRAPPNNQAKHVTVGA